MRGISCECKEVANMFVERFGGKVEGTTFIPANGKVTREMVEFSWSIPRHVQENGMWGPVE